jgi:hypothetical protein
MTTKARTTRQGIPDLNYYGSRKKAVEPGAAGPLAATESGAPAPADVAGEPTTVLVAATDAAISAT